MVSRSSFLKFNHRSLHNLPKKAIMMSARWAFDFSKWHPSENELILATSCLQLEEKERIAKFVFKKDFKASLIGRLLMRKYVSEVAELPYSEIQFYRDENGKPFCDAGVNFNVSHQGNFAVLAGEQEGQLLGIDVMKLEYTGGKSLNEFFRIMNKHFSAYEWATIRGEDGDKTRISMFYRHWSLKESYVKAIGVGITVNLQDISFKVNSKCLSKGALVTDTELFLKGVKQDWLFEEQLLDDEHCVSVAVKSAGNRGNVTGEKGDNKGGKVFRLLTFDILTARAVPLLEEDINYVKSYGSKLDKK